MPERVRVMGLKVDLLTTAELVDFVEAEVDTPGCSLIANHNLHSFYMAHHDPVMRKFYDRACLVHIDGMGVVLLARLLGHKQILRLHRSTYIDLAGPLFERAAQRGWRVFYLGSRPGVGEMGAEFFRARYSGLQLETHHGFFDFSPDSEQNQIILRKIGEYDPDLLLVGMGMPRQERWLLANRSLLKARATLCSGAMMDYYAGVVPTPPRWVGALGFEWAARLAAEPERLWRRYLIEPWFILKLAVRNARLERDGL